MGDHSEVIFCRICLRINLTQKYILSDVAQRKFIEQFFKENGCVQSLDEHSYACFECRSLLNRSYNFLHKALRAQKTLHELQESQEPITYTSLQSIDREKHNISLNLACYVVETYCLDPLDIKPDVIVKIEPTLQDPYSGEMIVTQNAPNNTNENKVIKSGSIDSPDSKSGDKHVAENDNYIENDHSSTSVPSNPKHLGLEYINENSLNNIDLNTPIFDIVGSQFIPIESCNEDEIKSEPEVIALDDSDAIEKTLDPLENKPVKNKKQRCSSEDSYTPEKAKAKKTKKRKGMKKPIQKRKVALNVFPPNEEVKRKRTKVEWPKMPVLEEKFRTRKKVNYKGLEEDLRIEGGKQEDEFVPSGDDSSDNSADNSYDSYDDEGKLIKRKQDTREFPMQCEECDSIVTSRKEHHYHYMQMHRDIEYPYKLEKRYILCTECGENVSAKMWQIHLDKHAGKKSECDVCHKQFTSRMRLLQHKRRVHQIVRPYSCEYCGKSFFLKSDLRLHIRTHTGEKPFKCHICDYRVAHKGNLYVHVRQVHQNLGPSRKNFKNDGDNSRVKKCGRRKKRSRKNEWSDEDSVDEDNEAGNGESLVSDSDDGDSKNVKKCRRGKRSRKNEWSDEDSVDEDNEAGNSRSVVNDRKFKKGRRTSRKNERSDEDSIDEDDEAGNSNPLENDSDDGDRRNVKKFRKARRTSRQNERSDEDSIVEDNEAGNGKSLVSYSDDGVSRNVKKCRRGTRTSRKGERSDEDSVDEDNETGNGKSLVTDSDDGDSRNIKKGRKSKKRSRKNEWSDDSNKSYKDDREKKSVLQKGKTKVDESDCSGMKRKSQKRGKKDDIRSDKKNIKGKKKSQKNVRKDDGNKKGSREEEDTKE